MRALIAKDWRFFRIPMLALLISGVGCYLVFGIALLYSLKNAPGVITTPINQTTAANPVRRAGEIAPIRVSSMSSEGMRRQILGAIDAASRFAALFAELVAAAFGGMAIAGERADRTADFIALLPVTRIQVALSKWLVSLLMLGICLGFHLLIAVSNTVYGFRVNPSQLLVAYEILTCGTFCLFGVAWLFSAFTKSGPISASLSYAVVLATTMLTFTVVHGHNGVSDKESAIAIAMVTTMIGVAGIFVGTIYYLRRIAP